MLRESWSAIPHLRAVNPVLTALMERRSRDGGEPPGASAWVSLDRISPYLICAVVAAEDPRFFEHRGVDWRQTAHSLRRAVRRLRRVRGVSTITQQLARNLYLHERRSIGRKLAEALLALRLERSLGKARVLELYLNLVEWGDCVWGADAAGRKYFGCSAVDLDPFQAAFLASLLPAPRAGLRGSNLRRALGSQRNIALALYATGLVSRSGENRVYYYGSVVERGLNEGRELHDVLRTLTNDRKRWTEGEQRHVPPSELLDTGCLGERRRSLSRFLDTIGTDMTLFAGRPMWWTT